MPELPNRDVRATPIGEMRLAEPGVIVHRLRSGVTVTETDAREIYDITVDLAEGGPTVVIVDMREVAFADRKARGAFSDAPDIEIATGLVVERGRISEDLAALFTKYSSPDRPVKMFEIEDEALDWARALLADHT